MRSIRARFDTLRKHDYDTHRLTRTSPEEQMATTDNAGKIYEEAIVPKTGESSFALPKM